MASEVSGTDIIFNNFMLNIFIPYGKVIEKNCECYKQKMFCMVLLYLSKNVLNCIIE